MSIHRPASSLRAQLLAVALIASVSRTLVAAPGDVTQIAAPALGAAAAKPEPMHDGDASVSGQTGAFEYSYPIEVPPGRLGIQPNLALRYSSQGATYGGLAAGWTLSIPDIRRDTSAGTLTFHSYPTESDRYVSTLAGGRPLIRVAEPQGTGTAATFRAQSDASYTRYEQMAPAASFAWRALSPDGTTHYFGDASHLAGVTVDWTRFPLTRSVDTFGNSVDYYWIREPVLTGGTDYRLDRVLYTANPGAGLPAFARVELDWAPPAYCPGSTTPIGATFDLRQGTGQHEGARALRSITAIAFDPGTQAELHRRTVTLGYHAAAASCTAAHAPVRLLTSIQETATGAGLQSVTLPAVTFDYGALERTLSASSYPLWDTGDAGDNLGWGRRSERGWPTVEATLADLDGDGLLDRLTMAGDPTECRFRWERNTGEGFAADLGNELELPRLPWTGAGDGPAAGEYCALNHQHTWLKNRDDQGHCGPGNSGTNLAYRWLDMTGDGRADLVTAIHHDPDYYNPNASDEPAWFGAWPSCDGGDEPACPAESAACMIDALTCDHDTCTFDDQRVLGCSAAAASIPCLRMLAMGANPSGWGYGDVHGEHGPIPFPGPGCDVPMEAHERCGQYPWMIYENQGDGTFASTPHITLSPVPLESDGGDSNIGGGGVLSNGHAIIDLDGDGLLDAVARGRHTETESVAAAPNWWFVWRGDGRGNFAADSNGMPFVWQVPPHAHVASGTAHKLDPTHSDDVLTESTATLADMNGDGLVDYLWREPGPIGGPTPVDVHIYYNKGRGFSRGPAGDFAAQQPTLPTAVQYTAQSLNDVDDVEHNGWINNGTRTATVRMLDLDEDGRSDLLFTPCGTSCGTPVAYYNDGARPLAASVAAPTQGLAALRQTMRVDSPALDDSYWTSTADTIDLDGDGQAERVSFSGGSAQRLVDAEADAGKPIRLLHRVRNGRGATVDVRYAASTDPAVVTSDLATAHTMPHPIWVVSSLAESDAFDDSVATHTYRYEQPVWSKDDLGKHGFRGFVRTRVVAPLGATTVDDFGYDVDWSGRQIGTRTYAAGSAAPHAIQETTWAEHTLFDGALKTIHATAERAWRCGTEQGSQTEAQCKAAGSGFVYTGHAITALRAAGTTGPSLLYAETAATTQRGETFADGDRRSETTFRLFADGATYRLRDTDRVSRVQVAGALTDFARSQRIWDPSYRVALDEATWSDAVDAHRAITRRTYDLATGNVLTEQRPGHVELADGKVTTLSYDSRKLFATRTTNELGQIVENDHDYGTGALLESRGPNQKGCGAGCVAWDRSRTVIDALGRPLEVWTSLDDATAGYVLAEVEWHTYDDLAAAGGQPTSATTWRLLDTTTHAAAKVQTWFDGAGQTIKQVEYTQGAAPSNATTTYDHDAEGHVVAVTLPDPSVNSAATVTYTYSYDSLGRATGMLRPDGSGATLSYAGLIDTRAEIAGPLGGPAARSKLVHDAFGRLVEVREYTSATAFASTTYGYDARDALARIVDPEANETLLTQDWAGRRTRVNREDRVWRYTYDKDGNLIAEESPHPVGLAAFYTTTTAYDALGRVSSRIPGKRDLTTADQTALGVGSITYSYDSGANGVGALREAAIKGPAQSVVLQSLYAYDARGNGIETTRTFNLGGISGARTTRQTFTAHNAIATMSYGDGATEAASTRSLTQYDARGLPLQIVWTQPNGTARTFGVQSRNVAGLVTERRSPATAGSAITRSAWTYDRLGRITDQLVERVAGGTYTQATLARQTFDYWGGDDPRRLRHALGTTLRDLSYTFDQRHQLLSASEAGNRYGGTFSYGSAGRLAHAKITGTSPQLALRDVDYRYLAPEDPEAPSALVQGATTLADYSYDSVGNVRTRRQIAGPTTSVWTFLYDGDDQQRRAIAPDGTREDYFYDHTGARIAAVSRSAANAVTRVRYWQGDTEIWFQPNGTVDKTWAHLSLGTPIARIENRTTAELQYHSSLSNLLVAVNATSGTTLAGYIYGPFAELLDQTGTTTTHQRRFNDKQFDDTSALAYYGVRYYDPLSLHWTQGDPLYRFAPEVAYDSPRRLSLYEYTLNNPLRFVDPDGRDSKNPIAIAVGIGAGLGLLGEACSQCASGEFSWNRLVSAAVGGAVGGLVAVVAGPRIGAALSEWVGVGMLGGATAGAVTTTLNGEAITAESMAVDGAMGALGGGIVHAFLPGGGAAAVGKSAPPITNMSLGVDTEMIVSNPKHLWGKTAEEIAGAFNDNGYTATVRNSSKGSMRSMIVSVDGHREISQIQVHPGGGRHVGAYVKISTNKGIIKVVDPSTYESSGIEKAKIVKME